MREIVDVLKEINGKLDDIIANQVAEKPAQDATGDVLSPEPIDDTPQHDPLAHLRVFDAVEGLHEQTDKGEIMEKFAKHDIRDWQGEVFDPVKDYWCGAGLRYLLCEGGFADPGINAHKASNYESYGEEVQPSDPNDPFSVPPGTILVYGHHCSVLDENGNECGGNVKNSYKRSPVAQRWFGTPDAYRKPVVA